MIVLSKEIQYLPRASLIRHLVVVVCRCKVSLLNDMVCQFYMPHRKQKQRCDRGLGFVQSEGEVQSVTVLLLLSCDNPGLRTMMQ